MSDLNIEISIAFFVGMIFVMILCIVVCCLWKRRQLKNSSDLLPSAVTETADQVSEQSAKLRVGLKRIADSPDPIRSLLEAMSGRHQNGSSGRRNG